MALSYPSSHSARTAARPRAKFPDLAALGSLAKGWGFDLVQLLPVNDSGCQSSPYSALSAFALNPLYLSMADLPELAGSGPKAIALREEAAAHAAAFAGDSRFRYGPYVEGKLAILEKIWGALGEPGLDGASFDAWVGANPWVKAYAVFVELKRLNAGKAWWTWTELREPSAEDIERLWKDRMLGSGCRFHAWMQWRAAEQFEDAARRLDAAGVAVLWATSPYSSTRIPRTSGPGGRVFRLEDRAGAPPDMYAEVGQNWGFPIYDWKAAARVDYQFWKERLAEAGRYYSAYRIDHVLGFFRIWTLSDRDETGYLGRFVPGCLHRPRRARQAWLFHLPHAVALRTPYPDSEPHKGLRGRRDRGHGDKRRGPGPHRRRGAFPLQARDPRRA